MSITINAKGTSVPYFTIGKNGTTVYQGSDDPSISYSMKNGDVWFNTLTNSVESWNSAGLAWTAPRLADLNFSGSTITAEDSADLTLRTTLGNKVILNSGTGNPTLSSSIGTDLYISESIGGALYLNTNKWPSIDGTVSQSLVTDGSGNLSWASMVQSLSGTPNQVSVSSSTGDAVVSLPNQFIAPGTLQYSTNMAFSFETIAAAGITQLTATLISRTYSKVSSAPSAISGVILPLPSFAGQVHIVDNHAVSQIYVYPHANGSIDSGNNNTPAYIMPGQLQQFLWDGATWNTSINVITAGNVGIGVSDVNGNISVSNTGVLSFSSGTTGFSPSVSSTGDIVLSGTLAIGNGGTNATSALAAFNNLSPLTVSGDILYSNGTSNSRLPIGATDYVLSVADGLPSWVNRNTLSVGSSTTSANIEGGTAGSVLYQAGASETSTLPPGNSNDVLSIQNGLPQWVTIPDVIGYSPVNSAGDTMTGPLILSADPVAALGAATKQYVDNIAQGLSALPACVTSTTISSNLSAATYYNGPIETPGLGATLTAASSVVLGTVGGFSDLTTSDRILVKDQIDLSQNGIYVVTSLGTTGISPWVLTRAADFDGYPTGSTDTGEFTFIQNGSLAGTQWVLTTQSDPVVMGTDEIVFSQLSGASDLIAGTGISIADNIVSNTGVTHITTGTGLSANTNATGAVSITNTGVTAITAGPGVSVSSNTGNITISASATFSTKTISSAYTILSSDYTLLVNAASGGFTITLPATAQDGEIHNIKKIDSTRTVVTISGNGRNIDKYTTIVINVPFVSIAVQWNSAANTWFII